MSLLSMNSFCFFLLFIFSNIELGCSTKSTCKPTKYSTCPSDDENKGITVIKLTNGYDPYISIA